MCEIATAFDSYTCKVWHSYQKHLLSIYFMKGKKLSTTPITPLSSGFVAKQRVYGYQAITAQRSFQADLRVRFERKYDSSLVLRNIALLRNIDAVQKFTNVFVAYSANLLDVGSRLGNVLERYT